MMKKLARFVDKIEVGESISGAECLVFNFA